MTREPITARKGYGRKVDVRVQFSSWGQGDAVKGHLDTHLTTEQARALAASLITAADQADAREDAKAAAEERRRAWRDREVAAGRMQIFSFRGAA